jgi:SAM-dependent methyltransferase
VRIGRLPDSHSFAGRLIDSPLAGGSLWRCSKCGFVFRSPLLSAETYNHLYRTGDLDLWDSEVEREDFRLIRQLLEVFDGQKLKVLDFGCYTGQLLTSLCKSFELFGTEPNSRAARVAADRGIKMVSGTIKDLIRPNDEYDVIVACDVIEHVPNPFDLLKQLRSQLKPNGMLVVSTGNCEAWLWRVTGARFWYCQFPEHISFIGSHWLRTMPLLAGLELQNVEHFNHRGRGISLLRILAAALFWLSPSCYRALRRTFFKPQVQIATPGNGATRDHLLCVFRGIAVKSGG